MSDNNANNNNEATTDDILAALDKLAEAYATDKNGNFDLNSYLAFKAGFDAGLGIAISVMKHGQLPN